MIFHLEEHSVLCYRSAREFIWIWNYNFYKKWKFPTFHFPLEQRRVATGDRAGVKKKKQILISAVRFLIWHTDMIVSHGRPHRWDLDTNINSTDYRIKGATWVGRVGLSLFLIQSKPNWNFKWADLNFASTPISPTWTNWISDDPASNGLDPCYDPNPNLNVSSTSTQKCPTQLQFGLQSDGFAFGLIARLIGNQSKVCS